MRKLITLAAIALALGGLLVVFNGAVDIPHFKSEAQAQCQAIIGNSVWGDCKPPSGGGGSITWTPTFANTGTGGFGTSYTVTGATLGTGDIVVFVYMDISGLGAEIPTVTVAGTSATLLGTVTDSSATQITVYLATGISSSTGNVVVSASTVADIAVAGGLITGENSGSGAVTGVDNLTRGDPQQATGSVPSGGIGIAFIAAVPGATNFNPTSWTSGAVGTWTRSATMESFDGSTAICAGASTTSSGSVTASATGTSAWAFANGGIAMVTFAN
jgi:hypothetical protein